MQHRTREMILAALFTALMAVSAYVWFPIPGLSVPFTLQVLFSLMAGLMLSPAHAAGSMAAYVLLGLVGAPVFSGGTAGLSTVLTTRFGYLLGFILAAFLAAVLRRKARGRRFSLLLSAVTGVGAIYAAALPYAALLAALYQGKPLALSVLLTAYFLAFLPLDLVKAVLAAFLAAKVNKALRAPS